MSLGNGLDTAQKTFHKYELERRTRLLQVIVPTYLFACAFVALLMIAIIFFVPLRSSDIQGFVASILLLNFLVGSLGWGYTRLQKKDLKSATIVVAIASVLGPSSAAAIWIILRGVDAIFVAELIPFSLGIIVVAILANRASVLITTGIMNLLTVCLLIGFPAIFSFHSFLAEETTPVLFLSIVYQWLFTVLILTFFSSYRRVLSDVGVAYDRLRTLDQLKDAFISSVNHELRTPLMAMQGYLETLRLGKDRLTLEQIHKGIDKVCNIGEDLVSLVQGILSVRHLEQIPPVTPQSVQIQSALDSAITLLGSRESSGLLDNFQAVIPSGLAINGDPVFLQQILLNLISNALKYSERGSRIIVKAQTYQGLHSSPTVLITIRDYGHGIPPEQISLLFQRFVRLPRDLASNIMGNGLGLYLCSVYCEAMSGHIWVESTGIPGEGSTFFIQLPVAEAAIDKDVHKAA
jgi:signal transduction histidine kinase